METKLICKSMAPTLLKAGNRVGLAKALGPELSRTCQRRDIETEAAPAECQARLLRKFPQPIGNHQTRNQFRKCDASEMPLSQRPHVSTLSSEPVINSAAWFLGAN